MSEVTEKQAIEGFVDALKQASSLSIKCANPEVNPDSSRLFVKCMSRAAGYANVLGNYQQNLDWYRVRDMLEDLTVSAANMAINNLLGITPILNNGANGFLSLSKTLLDISKVGHRIATSKAVKRDELLAACDAREKIIASRNV